jgi:CoA:oxalate CoA-transferase
VLGCLDGVRVLELARWQAGPRAGLILSDLGAEVLKIEKPGGEETRTSPPMHEKQSLYFGTYNRGKKSICLDLRQREGIEIFQSLVPTADFVLENFRPGTMEKMGLGYESLCALKPDIIMLRVSGFGQYGPYIDKPGFDPIGQAMSGLMMLTGQDEGKPIQTAFSLIDRLTALHCVIGAVAALRHRDRTGEGQVVDVCLMDSALTTVEIPTSYFLSTGVEGGESGRAPFKAQDGWVVVSAGTPNMQRSLLDVVGLDPDKGGKADPIALQSPHHPLRVELARWCEARPVEEICRVLEQVGVVVGPVRSIPAVAKDPHLWEREMLVKVKDPYAGEIFVPGLTIKFSKSPGEIGPVARPGEHTPEVLADVLGYSESKIDDLRDRQII